MGGVGEVFAGGFGEDSGAGPDADAGWGHGLSRGESQPRQGAGAA